MFGFARTTIRNARWGRWARLAPTLAVLLPLSAANLGAQDTGAAERAKLIQITPLGFLQAGPSIEFQARVAPAVAAGVGFRVISAGLLSHVLIDDLEFTWTAIANIAWYPRRRLAGWYIAPRVEIGRSSREHYTSKLLAGANEIGYRWVKPSGLSWSVGLLGGVSRANYTHRTEPLDVGTDYYVLAMGVIGLGFVF